MLKKKLETLRTRHDLTLCRTGRKPESPELKYRLKQAKKNLKQEIAKLPEAGEEATQKEESKADDKKAEKKAEKKEEKKEAEAEKKEEKKESSAPGRKELGESAEVSVTENDPHLKNQLIYEFHKLIDASGGHESFDERAKMWRSMVADEQAKEVTLRRQFGLEHKN